MLLEDPCVAEGDDPIGVNEEEMLDLEEAERVAFDELRDFPVIESFFKDAERDFSEHLRRLLKGEEGTDEDGMLDVEVPERGALEELRNLMVTDRLSEDGSSRGVEEVPP